MQVPSDRAVRTRNGSVVPLARLVGELPHDRLELGKVNDAVRVNVGVVEERLEHIELLRGDGGLRRLLRASDLGVHQLAVRVVEPIAAAARTLPTRCLLYTSPSPRDRG